MFNSVLAETLLSFYTIRMVHSMASGGLNLL